MGETSRKRGFVGTLIVSLQTVKYKVKDASRFVHRQSSNQSD